MEINLELIQSISSIFGSIATPFLVAAMAWWLNRKDTRNRQQHDDELTRWKVSRAELIELLQTTTGINKEMDKQLDELYYKFKELYDSIQKARLQETVEIQQVSSQIKELLDKM